MIGGERTLQGAGAEEHGGVLGQPAERRGRREPDQAHDEHALAAEVVGDAPAQQQQAGEGERVRRQHPLAVGRRDVQRLLRRGQGDDDDGGVEHHHQLGDGDDAEGAEALGVAGRADAAVVRWRAGSGSGRSRVEVIAGLPSPGGRVVRWSFGSRSRLRPRRLPSPGTFLERAGFGARNGLQSESEFWFHLDYTEPRFRLSTGEEVRSVGPKSKVAGGCDEPIGEERPLRADAAAQPWPHPRCGRGGLRRRGHRGPGRRHRREGRRRRGHALPALPDQGEALRGDPPRSPARPHRGRPRPGRGRGPRRRPSSASSTTSSCWARPSAT